MIIEYEGKRPRIGQDVFIAPTAVVIGDVEIGDGASVWYGVVLRGDEGRIVIGRGSNVQDNAVIHTTTEIPTILKEDVTIGHGALLEGCTVEDRKSTRLNSSHLGSSYAVFCLKKKVAERDR